jgi:hypothetical protein
MAQIYSDCSLAIDASGGWNAHAGLFVDRNPQWYKPCHLNVAVVTPDQSVSGALLISGNFLNDEQPLYDRAWALQEEILSTRTVIFGEPADGLAMPD